MRKIRILGCLICLSTMAWADVCVDKIYYYLDKASATATVIANPKHKYMGQVTIPQEIVFMKRTYRVTRVGDQAFRGCTQLTAVTFPSSVTSIGNSAFSDCTGLTSLLLPSTITSIEDYSFSDCSALNHLVLSDGIRKISDFAFSGCNSLTHLALPNGLQVIGEYAFNRCNSLTTVIVPQSVQTIERKAFAHCDKLVCVCGRNILFENPYAAREVIPYLYVLNGSEVSVPFADYMRVVLAEEMARWKQKSQFESASHYQQRISPAGQDNQLKKFYLAALENYMNYFAADDLHPVLGEYDSRRQCFEVSNNQVKLFTIPVPDDEAEWFAANWETSTFSPEFEMVGDQAVISACTVQIQGKTYRGHSDVVQEDVADNRSSMDSHMSIHSTIGQEVDVDQNIPVTTTDNERTFAVVIGNENYKKVSHVNFAKNDAAVFAEYCQKTLGIPQPQVRLYTDITYGDMLMALKDIKSIANAYDGKIHVIFYYAGHGVPNESSRDAYLLPVDADGTDTEVCMPISRLYSELAGMKAESVVVLMDACFSGSQRGEGMLASARGVALKTKTGVPEGNMVVLSAASGDETAFPYHEKRHGLFTYYLLKKLQDTEGRVTIYDLGNYITTQVKQQSVVVNRKSQTPSITPSRSIGDAWRNWQMR